MSIAETVARVKEHYQNLLKTAEDEHEWAHALAANDALRGTLK